MKVKDYLEITPDSRTVIIIKDECEVSRYDGRNSIDTRYNNCKIVGVMYQNMTLTLWI